MDKLKMHSTDNVAGNIEKLMTAFPHCAVEAFDKDGKVCRKLDWDLLRQELSEKLVEGNQERYTLSWPGKREAMLLANSPVAKTLRPCREESVDFDNTKNLYIEGDNLDVLKLLQENYLGKIKMIYIDPPYNTGNDFVYEDDFSEDSESYLKKSNQKDEQGNRLVANTESNGRFHSDWLSMMYPRLKLARSLLTDDGVIFISIDDNEVHNLRKLCDEIFGEENFISSISRMMKSGGAKGNFFTPNIDLILVYTKNIHSTLYFRASITEEQIERYYNKQETTDERKGEIYGEERLYKASLDPRPNQRYWIECPDGSFVIPPGVNFPKKIEHGFKIVPTSEDGVWKWIFERYEEERKKGNIIFKQTTTSALVDSDGNKSKWNIYNKLWLKDQAEKGIVPSNFIEKFENRQSAAELKELGITFDFAKPMNLIKYLLQISITSGDDIILDFFSGSATTAHAVMQLNAEDGGNRRFIIVQLPESCDEKSEAYKAGYKNICEIGKERIRRAGKKIHEELDAKKQNRKAKAEKSRDDLFAVAENAATYSPISNLTLRTASDFGFRVLKLDSSNMEDVYYTPREYKQDHIDAFESNIKPDRSPEDLLFQVMLDWGLDLALPVTVEKVKGKTVFFADGNALAACFDDNVTESVVKAIAGKKPLRVVFRDSSFASDSTKINVEEIFKLLSPSTEVKAI